MRWDLVEEFAGRLRPWALAGLRSRVQVLGRFSKRASAQVKGNPRGR